MSFLKALLVRHETHIADSERERNIMMAQIESLEAEKQMLEHRNAAVTEENRSLLEQLEAVNNAVIESDTQVTNLQATLLSTQQELQKLSYLAARTERLEQQVVEFEREQASWQSSLAAKEDSEKSAVRRWQQAERTLADLEDQIERIEREAREERKRHVEMLGRMERRHAVEAELHSAAGRLKGAAAAKTAGREAGGTNVVSHFVKDILQDNANLQMGIVELREMLQSSNDEVDNLRKQLIEHQPSYDADTPASDRTVKQQDLRQELQRATSQELHVHHHYHAPPPVKAAPALRRTKKKRYGVLTPGHFTPPASGYSTPRSSISYGAPSSVATILEQTAVSVPQQIPKTKRFSVQSTQTCHSIISSSGPSSPQSTTNRTSSIFDRVFSDAGDSRPTTPGTEDPGSPIIEPMHCKQASGSSFRTFSAPVIPNNGRLSLDAMLGSSLDAALAASERVDEHDTIPEENEADWQDESFSSPNPEDESSATYPLSDDLLEPIHHRDLCKQRLRRAASHESLLSISGMDIHTLKARPSQLLTSGACRAFTTEAIISDAHAQAIGLTMSKSSNTGRSLLSGMAAERQLQHKPSSIGSKVGGWVFGRWGATPTPTKNDTDTASKSSAESTSKLPSSRSSLPQLMDAALSSTPTKALPKVRAAGINQPGAVLGFRPEIRQQHLPVMKSLDEEGLRRALGY